MPVSKFWVSVLLLFVPFFHLTLSVAMSCTLLQPRFIWVRYAWHNYDALRTLTAGADQHNKASSLIEYFMPFFNCTSFSSTKAKCLYSSPRYTSFCLSLTHNPLVYVTFMLTISFTCLLNTEDGNISHLSFSPQYDKSSLTHIFPHKWSVNSVLTQDPALRVSSVGISTKSMGRVSCFCMVDAAETKTALRPLMHAPSSVPWPSKSTADVSVGASLLLMCMFCNSDGYGCIDKGPEGWT